jgi:hypothetical protein
VDAARVLPAASQPAGSEADLRTTVERAVPMPTRVLPHS